MSPRFALFSSLALLGLISPALAHWPGLAGRTAPAKPAKTEQRFFAVADLVVPIPSQPKAAFKPLPEEISMKAWHERQPGFRMPPAPRENTREAELMNLVMKTVAADSWRDLGGRGTLQYYPLGMSLVVNNTPQVLEEVSDLIAALRRLQDVQAKLRVIVLHVEPEHVEQAARDLKLHRTLDKALVTPAEKSACITTPTGRTWSAPLTRQQTEAFFRLMQKSERSTVMQTPTITAFNGQNTHVEIVEEKFYMTSVEITGDAAFFPRNKIFAVGSRFALQPTVSADRRAVRLDLEASLADLAGDPEMMPVQIPLKVVGENAPRPFQIMLQKPTFTKVHVKPQLTIPDGDSALLHCGVLPVEVTRVRRHPLFGELPLIGEWCVVAEKTREPRSVVIVVTPKVIVQEEAE